MWLSKIVTFWQKFSWSNILFKIFLQFFFQSFFLQFLTTVFNKKLFIKCFPSKFLSTLCQLFLVKLILSIFFVNNFQKKIVQKLQTSSKNFEQFAKSLKQKKILNNFFEQNFFFKIIHYFQKFFFANLVSSFLLISTCESTMTFTRKTFDFEKGSSLSVIEIIPFCFTFSQLIYGIYILPLFSRFCYNKFWHTFFSIFLIGVKNNNFDVKKAKYWCKKTNCLCTIIGLKMEQI